MSFQAAFCNKPDVKGALCPIKGNISLMELQAVSDNLEDGSVVSDERRACIVFQFLKATGIK